MKLLKKLNSKGFSHIETLLILVVVAVIGVTGYYVWNHNKTNNTANAGGYNYRDVGGTETIVVGPKDTVWGTAKVLACKTSLGGTNYRVHALAKTSRPLTFSAVFTAPDFTTKNGNTTSVAPETDNWTTTSTSSVAKLAFNINTGVNNFIDFRVVPTDNNKHGAMNWVDQIRGSKIANCTAGWVTG